MSLRFPGESSAYRIARERLLQQEVELRRLSERVARARRELPRGGAIPEDYAFEEAHANGQVAKVCLSELFAHGQDSLLIYNLVYDSNLNRLCPRGTALLDGIDGAAIYINQRVSLVIVSESPAARLEEFAKARGWKNLRCVSSASNRYNRDYLGQTIHGDVAMLNVFKRIGHDVFHHWGSELVHSPGDHGQEDHRALDSLNPVFAALDLTPEGRGDYSTSLECRLHRAA